MNKYQIASIQDHVLNDFKVPENWMEFLSRSAWHYKYSFYNQILITYQREDATAVTTMNAWNKKLNRYVNAGAKRILIINETKKHLDFVNVFDLKDTHLSDPEGFRFSIWNYKSEDEHLLLNELKQRLNVVEFNEIKSIKEYLSLVICDIIDKNQDEYTAEIKYESNIYYHQINPLEFKKMLINSAILQVFERCGIDGMNFFKPEDFAAIKTFNNFKALNLLGAQVNAIAKPLLIEIGKAILEIEKEKSKGEKNYGLNKTQPHVRSGRRLSQSKSSAVEATESINRKIRADAIGISQGTSALGSFGNDFDRHDQRTFGGSGPDSETTTKPDHGEDEQIQPRTGSEYTPNRMGGTYENDREAGGGNYSSGNSIHQIDLFSYNQEISQEAESGKMPSAFSVSEDVITRIIQSGTNDRNSDLKIAYQFSLAKAPESNCTFLKEYYKEGGKGLEINSKPYAVYWNKEGLYIGHGNTVQSNFSNNHLSWTDVEERIEKLLGEGSYLTRERLSMVLGDEIDDLSKKCVNLYRDFEPEGKSLFSNLEKYISPSFPESVEKIKELITESVNEDHQFIDNLALQMFGIHNVIQNNPEVIRFNYHHPDKISNMLKSLSGKHLFFQSHLDILPPVKRFITQDEVDRELLNGSGVEDGKYRIYHFFNGKHSEKEKIDFLKKEYGTGGHSAMDQIEAWHDSKGIIYRWDNDDAIKLNWQQVEKRIDALIRNGQYHLNGYFGKAMFENILINETPYPDLKQAIATAINDEKLTIQDKEVLIKQLYQIEGVSFNPEQGEFIQDYTKRGIHFIRKDNPKEIHFQSWYSVMSSIRQLLDYRRKAYFPEHFNDSTPNNDHEQKNEESVIVEKSSEMISTSETSRKDLEIEKNISDNEPETDERELHPAGFDSVEEAYFEENEMQNTLEEPKIKEIEVGDQYEIEGRLFEVDSVDLDYDTVNLRDITFHEKTGYPIFRNESLKFVNSLEKHIPTSEKKQSNVRNFKLRAVDQQLQSAREKFKSNLLAIETLRNIESRGKIATLEEQTILSQYVGWGGLAQVFDAGNIHWKPEYEKLKAVLSNDEYSKARESTLNAHYTSPTIIKAMYSALSNMGFDTGNILEPAMGVGHFFGLLPDTMKGSKLYGVEIDSLTCRIAKQLYPQANIFEGGFEKTDYSNNFFDVAIGNVPFGDYHVYDKEYQKENLLIHDYFFAKSLDKLRPGGVMAMITSKGTMDKKSPVFREYMAKRAELLGAVRLPNTAFNHAGTEVTSDILFFRKRDRMILANDEWVHLNTDKNGIPMNSYFIEHPEMIIGEMSIISGRFGDETACLPIDGKDLGIEIKKALENINYHFPEDSIENILDEDDLVANLPADPNVENFSYTVIDNQLYFRKNSIMSRVNLPDKAELRIKGMVELRDCVRRLLRLQLDDANDSVIKNEQQILNSLYDQFVNINGQISSRGNKLAFEEDGAYWLLCALEKVDDDGNFIGKSDIFSQRTIQPFKVTTSVDTANEALIASIGEKACVDLNYMSGLCNKTTDQIVEDLRGVIFHDPEHDSWVTADEYLSGNVRHKLEYIKSLTKTNDNYQINASALAMAQPKDLEASEIEVNLGATWIDAEFIDQFILETFKPAAHIIYNQHIKVNYSPHNGSWNISGKSLDNYNNVLVTATYGTQRANAYRILENALNLKDMRIMDKIDTPDGDRLVVNREETILANQKQELIKEAFKDWIFKDQERRNILVEKYNRLFNSTRPRAYDGQHIILHGVSPEIQLRDYQKNAIARALYGGNTLLGHCVGAGKTYEMAAIAMESKYLGLCNKSMFVVPNHLVGQWGTEFLALYPGANILIAQKKDFLPANRKKFCSRVATGNYDAVIIGHSQFEKIPLSKEFQAEMINRQINNVLEAINDAVESNSEQYTVKQLEKTRKNLEARLEKLNDLEKDNTVTFEELGIDRLFVDEAHSFKNLFLYTKMRNVAGIGQSEALKSTDMFNKCQYMDELTGSKGVIFATGTPISNSISELYTMMRYLQYDRLQESGLGHFDCWAGNFTQQVTAIELSPEGTGYRSKTRLARFYNLPELMSFFKEVADIQTPDMLQLPVPEVVYEDVIIKPSAFQKDMLNDLVERAEAVRNRSVEPNEDNMLKITNDGRKLALDQRLINPLLPDNFDSKANRCVEKAFEIWKDTKDQKTAQLLFCDLSTPHADGRFNVYEDIKTKLLGKGVPESEIAFIHDASTDAKKITLFGKVRSGQIRFLLGSTQKMGAGTNVQDRLIALHHLDVPWKPSDIEQQEGRILRQGNINREVKIFRYITEETFDAYSWQLIENKQKFIGQVITSKSPTRSCEDVDEQALSYAEIKALATGNPLIKEKMDLDIKVTKLKLLKANFVNQQYRMEDNITKKYPQILSQQKELKEALENDYRVFKSNKHPDQFKMLILDKTYTDKKEAGQALIKVISVLKSNKPKFIGEYVGFKLFIVQKGFDGIDLILKDQAQHHVTLGPDEIGNIIRINNSLENTSNRIACCEQEISDTQERLVNAQIEIEKPFIQEKELSDSLIRLKELDMLLSTDQQKVRETEETINDREGCEDCEWAELEI